MTNVPDRLRAALADRYPVERELGSGGMATVYLARDVKHGRRVAVKVLRPELAATLGADRFLREIEIAARLAHPHILPLFDSGEADGFFYYVMPYVEGESLRERLGAEKTLPVEEVVRIADQIASALTHAHERGVIHRDIKPENILFTGDQAIVADFGIARAVALASSERLTGTGLAIGTPAYMSPEQAVGADDVDEATDIYALGCVVYEMFAGSAPFEAPSPQAMLAKHAMGTVPSLRTSDPQIPAPVNQVIARALAKQPTDRFATATELAQALAVAITPEAEIANARRVARRRWARVFAGMVVVALLLAGGRWLAGSLAAPAIERLAVLPASNMGRDPEQDYFVDGVQEALTAELQRAGISIIARQSVLRYRNSDKTFREIAEELGVDGLIQPVVGREGDSVFVDVSLYDANSQIPIWTATFPAEMRGVLGLYRDISRRIATEIGAVLSASADARLVERPTVDPELYEAVLKGRFHLGRFTPQDFDIAQQYFESALAIDSTYAPAHVGLGSVWGYRSQAGLLPPMETRPILVQHTAKALELDPQLASARFQKAARLVWGDLAFDEGEVGFREALELDPNDAQHQVFYGHLLAIQGRREEAARRGELAMELDPLNPFVTGLYGTLLSMLGRTDEAIELLQNMLEANPGASFGRNVLVEALLVAGRDDEALELRRAMFAQRGDQEVVATLENGVAAGGPTEAWRRAGDVLASRPRSRSVGAIQVAVLYAAAGETELAIDWLEIAVEQRDQNLAYIGVVPAFWDLHDQPRFQAVARAVGVRPQKPDR